MANTASVAELFALPLQSAIRAQALANREAVELLYTIGVEKGALRDVTLRANRIVEETTVDASGRVTTTFVDKPFEVKLPVLALLGVPSVSIGEMTVDFDLRIVELKSDALGALGKPPATSLASSVATLASRGDRSLGTMQVNMRITPQAPEGLAKLTDIIAELISARSLEKK